MTQPQSILARRSLTTPRAAAVAGIAFSLLLITSLALIRLAVPQDPQDAGNWLEGDWRSVTLALNLLPFAGIAFLWFMGVVRDRLGLFYWAPLVFPLWVLLISMHILLANLRPSRVLDTTGPAQD